MAEEHASLFGKGAIERELYRPGLRLIGMKWIFTYKTRADGSIERYKARLVVQGFTQQFGLNYTEVWAPTGSLAAYRLLLVHAAIHDYDV
jgi:hypothetical protein